MQNKKNKNINIDTYLTSSRFNNDELYVNCLASVKITVHIFV